MNSYFKEGLKKLYKEKDALDKQISIFSLLGIFSIAMTYISLEHAYDTYISNIKVCIILTLYILWHMYFFCYETKFLNNALNSRDTILPEINLEPLKILKDVTPLAITLISTTLILFILHNPQKAFYYSTISDIVISFFITIFQMGYAKNLSNKEIIEPFKKIKNIDFIKYFFKRIWIYIGTALMSYGIVFLGMLVLTVIAIVSGFINSQTFTDLIFSAQSSQMALVKLSTYSTNILYYYLSIMGLLAWDYDLAKKYIETAK